MLIHGKEIGFKDVRGNIQEIMERKSKTFLDVPKDVRLQKLKNFRTDDLKVALPSEIWNDFMKVYFEEGCDGEAASRVLNYCVKNSKIFSQVSFKAGSAEPFSFLYRFDVPDNIIDEYIVRSMPSIGIHLRMMSLEDNLVGIIRREIIRQDLDPGDKFVILDVGSGPGDAIRKALRKKHNEDLLDKIEVHCVDPNKWSIVYGKKLVERDGLSDTIKFFNQTIFDYAMQRCGKKSNLLLVIGMLCSMPNNSCVSFLSSLYKISSVNSSIIYSTVQESMLLGDPFADLFMRMVSWSMHYKISGEDDLIGEFSGWKVQDCFYDQLGYNRMTIGYKNI